MSWSQSCTVEYTKRLYSELFLMARCILHAALSATWVSFDMHINIRTCRTPGTSIYSVLFYSIKVEHFCRVTITTFTGTRSCKWIREMYPWLRGLKLARPFDKLVLAGSAGFVSCLEWLKRRIGCLMRFWGWTTRWIMHRNGSDGGIR